jgi:hypothetical protein
MLKKSSLHRLWAALGAAFVRVDTLAVAAMPAGGNVDGDLLARANTVASSAGGESRQGAGSEYSDYYYSDYEGGGKAEEGGAASGSNQYTPRSGADSAAPSGEGAGTGRSAYSSEPPNNNTNRSGGSASGYSQPGTARSGAGGSTDRSGGSAPVGYSGSDPAAETARSGYSGDPPFSWFEMASVPTSPRNCLRGFAGWPRAYLLALSAVYPLPKPQNIPDVSLLNVQV